MSKFKSVLFDMDGVLIDSEPCNLNDIKDFILEYGGKCDEAFLLRLVGGSHYMSYVEIKGLLKADWTLDEFTKNWHTFIKQRPYDYTKILNEGVMEIMKYINDLGLKIGICSSNDKEEIVKMVRSCGCEPYVEHIISGQECSRSKPNPEVYLTMAKHLGLHPSQCLVVEDSTVGIEAGKRANMKVLALKDKHFGIRQDESDAIINDLSEIKAHLN